MLTTELSLFALVLNASLPVQGVIGILVIVSIISWAVIFSKLKVFFVTTRSTNNFEEEFCLCGIGSVTQNIKIFSIR